MNDTLSLLPSALEDFAQGALSIEDLGRTMRDAAQELSLIHI